MNNMLQKILSLFKLYWGYFMTVVAAVTFIWTLGVKSGVKSKEKISVKEDIIEIKEQLIKEKQKTDSLLVIVNNVKAGQNNLIENQNAMRNSYVSYLSSRKFLTKEEFIKYMEKLEFELTPIQMTNTNDTIVNVGFNISIKK